MIPTLEELLCLNKRAGEAYTKEFIIGLEEFKILDPMEDLEKTIAREVGEDLYDTELSRSYMKLVSGILGHSQNMEKMFTTMIGYNKKIIKTTLEELIKYHKYK